MVRILLIRHGEPDGQWGVDDDPGLSLRGRDQARAAASIVAGAEPVGLVSSPMRRCRDTAAPAAQLLRQNVGVDPNVGEVRTPIGVEDRRAWLRRNFNWRQDAPRVQWSELERETREWRDAVLSGARAWRGDIAVFTHFVAINVIVGAALDSEDTIVCAPDFASVTELELLDGVLKLKQLGAQMQSGEVL